MPTFLVHGFRWPRPLIRIHIILQNLDDAAAEWLLAPKTTAALRSNFAILHPTIMPHLPDLRFIEQYNPDVQGADSTKSQPYAYVADVVHEVKLGVDIDEVRGKGVSNEAWGAMVDLRDALAPGERVAWFVVVCADVEREVSPTVKVLENAAYFTKVANGVGASTLGTENSVTNSVKKHKSKLSMLFSKTTKNDKEVRRTQSNKALNSTKPHTPTPFSPAVPQNGIYTPPRTAVPTSHHHSPLHRSNTPPHASGPLPYSSTVTQRPATSPYQVHSNNGTSSPVPQQYRPASRTGSAGNVNGSPHPLAVTIPSRKSPPATAWQAQATHPKPTSASPPAVKPVSPAVETVSPAVSPTADSPRRASPTIATINGKRSQDTDKVQELSPVETKREETGGADSGTGTASPVPAIAAIPAVVSVPT